MPRLVKLSLCVLLLTAVILLGNSATAFCAPGEDKVDIITNSVEDVATETYKGARAIISPLCIVALAFAGFQFIVGGQRGADMARKTVIACLFAIAFVGFAPMLIQTVVKAALSSATSSNPLDKA